MLFSSITFLYYFLPATLVLYFAAPKKLKNLELFIASIVFYAWGEPKYVILMLATILSGYIYGLVIDKYRSNERLCKAFAILSVATSLSALLYFKYADFFIANFNAVTGLSVPFLNVALPIGISFYTFQILSYTVDVYRGNVACQKNLLTLATYISLFPQLIAGPIVRYGDVEKELSQRTHSVEKVIDGVGRFVVGLSKKILVANTLGELCEAFKSSTDLSVLYFWLYAIAFSLHIYFDFSGYSDMAIGLGKIFGFEFAENFNYPYISKSGTEFWRRWHISLGSWFRDYVYIPLGGNRKGTARNIFNIFIVWLLTGFWHGAAWNFVAWGLYFAVILVIEKFFIGKCLEKSKVLSHVYLILVVVVSFVIFDASSLSQGFERIVGMFGGAKVPVLSAEAIYCVKNYVAVFVVAIIGATPLPKKAAIALKNAALGEKTAFVVKPLAICALLILCTAYLVDGSYNPFLYFRF